MKTIKKIAVILMLITLSFCFIGCGNNSDENTVKVYHMEGSFNSETTNMWRDLYIVDEDTYILTIQVLKSDGSGEPTVDYLEKGIYKTNADGTITLKDGVGGGYAMNEDKKIAWTEGMDILMSVNGVRTFSLNEDGTWTPVE